ncbi:MAG: spore germination protein [Clostridia bacterium]|nr:spore germination protein [Clostridia bacterium]
MRARLARDDVETLLGRTADRLTGRIARDLASLRRRLGRSPDVVARRFRTSSGRAAALVYVDGLVAAGRVETQVVHRLMRPTGAGERANDPLARLVSALEVRPKSRLSELPAPIFAGDVALLLDGSRRAFLLGFRQPKERNLGEPETEAVIRGPREGFVESLRTNTSLLRRRLRDGDLRIRQLVLGRRTHTAVAVCYIRGVASPDLVREVFRRLRAIEVDGVLESGYLEQYIEDNRYSPFPQIINTERPDKVVGLLLEGRVAILTDGTPFALVVPGDFTQLYQTPEDYYQRFHIASFIRFVRLVSLFISLTMSALYVSLISFNPEMIPTKFAVAVAGARAGIPFPSAVEVLMLEVIMEILREASLHLPKTVGNAISIVGVLVIGQAAVSSGFVSPISVVIVALAAIGSFATPAFNAAIALRLLRFVLIVMAGLFGLYGTLIGLIFIVNHMLSLESFGEPYMAPVAPFRWPAVLDALFVRAPLWVERRRPESLAPREARRRRGGALAAFDEKQPVLDPARPRRPGRAGSARGRGR